MKQLENDPWQNIDKFEVGKIYKGIVTNLTDYGAFIDLEDGIEGLVHVSEISWTKKNLQPAKVLSVSSEVDVMVLEIDREKRRISLGLKQCTPNPWKGFAETHNVNDVINQGDLLGYTGTAGYVTGDHVHFQCANGLYAGWEQVPPDYNWQLKNEMHIYDACYVNDTTIINGYNYNWREWNGPTPPSKKKEEKHFPWVLYARKFRKLKR